MEEYKLDDAYKELSNQYSRRFGKIAVDKKFIMTEELKEAMAEQIEDDISNKPHRLIGQILLQKGWITDEQIEIVLNELYKVDA